jgi:hypothetical protein
MTLFDSNPKNRKYNYLFLNFLKDINEFHKAQNYWLQLCREVLESSEQSENWTFVAEPPQTVSNFSSWRLVRGYNTEKTKGFSIEQQDPKQHTKWEMLAYTQESHRFSNTQPIVQLQYACNLSGKSAEVFRALLTKWIQPDCDRNEMERFIESFAPLNKAN